MVLEIRQTTPGPIDVLPGWRRHGGLGSDDDHLAAIHAVSMEAHVDRLAEIPRFSSPEAALKVLLAERACSPMPTIVGSRAAAVLPAPAPNAASTKPASFTFKPRSRLSTPLDFSPPPQVQSRGVKRRRHALDVDGPNTAELSCKKRRLRAQLITSRLSQPFSQPATHILNREGLKSGDKRFYKIASSIDTARRIAHLHATSLLRFCLMNSLRSRLGLVGRLATERSEHSTTEDDEMDTTSKAPWQPQSLQAASGSKYPQTHTAHGTGTGHAITSVAPERAPGPIPKVAVPAAKTPTCRLSKPAALPRPSADAAAVHGRTSPRIHPVRSPELRPLYSAYDDLDEDSFAFLHPEDDGSDDITDDPEHVYSDFSVIFGGGGSHAPASPSDDHSYEEYLDELDGISWVSG
ncbi:hypothetical protein HJFPF1_07058 [Paramyrothecium foliicola]|nr:hypothetical protein HJFPF1_07058 [Paramyrothecium foliicola]